jgi:hypothetical protein
MALEQQGVPTVAVHTDRFERLVRTCARAGGMPTARQAFVPQPVVDRTTAELRAYIEGEDPITRRPFVHELIEGLTRPLDATDAGLTFDRSIGRLLEPGSDEELRARFGQNRWTDFLPIVLPTEERVEWMLTGTSQAPDRVVGRLAPTAYREPWEFTVEKVAVNAVMAGALPEHLPVILAAMATGLTARQSSTTSFATYLVVNGPIRHELAMNAGIGALGPYNQANTAIGRAYCLSSQNLQGGSVPEESYMGSLGNPLAYSLCFPENEERSPWSPFHVERGYDADASVVTAVLGGWNIEAGTGVRETWRERFTRAMLACDPSLPPFVVLDPLAAQGFVRRGFGDKQSLREWLADATRGPAREYWDNQMLQSVARAWGVAGVEPYASRLQAGPNELIRAFEPEQINIAVVGGETQPLWRIIGGVQTATEAVDEWR